MLKFKKASVADVLWLMALLLMCVIVINLELQFSGTQAIDSYAKDIANREATRFVTNINGFSLSSDSTTMYAIGDNTATPRKYSVDAGTISLPMGPTVDISNLPIVISEPVATSLGDKDASSLGVMKYSMNEMKSRIEKCFGNGSVPSGDYPDVDVNESLKSRTVSYVNPAENLQDGDVEIYMKDTGKTTLVTVKVKYNIVFTNYEKKDGGIFSRKDDQKISRTVVITRNIENVSRFAN